MSNRRFEMFEIRTVLVRLRRGDSCRAIARSGLMGRNKLRRLRVLADRHGWLVPVNPLPDHDEIRQVVGRVAESVASGDSSVEPYRSQVESWVRQGIQATAIHQGPGAQPPVRRQLFLDLSICPESQSQDPPNPVPGGRARSIIWSALEYSMYRVERYGRKVDFVW